MTPVDKNVTPAEKTPEDLLREEIVADAKRQAERLLRKASKEVSELAAKSKETADKECAKVLANAKSTAAHRAELLCAKVPVEVGRYRAAHIEEQLNAVRESTAKKLEALPITAALLVRLIGDAAHTCGGGDFIVSLSKTDRSALEKNASWQKDAAREAGVDCTFTLSGEMLPPASRGPLLTSADGTVICDNRLDARLARLWPSLRCIIAERLGYVADTKEKKS